MVTCYCDMMVLDCPVNPVFGGSRPTYDLEVPCPGTLGIPVGPRTIRTMAGAARAAKTPGSNACRTQFWTDATCYQGLESLLSWAKALFFVCVCWGGRAKPLVRHHPESALSFGTSRLLRRTRWSGANV